METIRNFELNLVLSESVKIILRNICSYCSFSTQTIALTEMDSHVLFFSGVPHTFSEVSFLALLASFLGKLLAAVSLSIPRFKHRRQC